MREQLIRYVELLFAGAENAGDIQQEILQNTLDRYDDLIAQGKTPEAAYRLAISGIGDINEILGSAGGAAPKATGAVPQPVQKGVVDAKWQPLLRVLSIVCYILCPLPLFLIQDEAGLCLLLVMVALGVALGMLASPGKGNSESETTGKEVSAPRQAVRSLIGITGLAFYLAVSFATRAWWITWLVFPLTGCVSGLVMAVWDLCVQKGGVASGVVRIVIFTLLALALVAALVFSVGFSSTSGPISDLFCIWNTSQVDGISSPSGSVSAQEVSRLAIHWVAGSVRVEPSENATDISFRLIGEDDAKFPMVWSQSGDTLILSYTQTNKIPISVNVRRKDLVVTVPAGWAAQDISIDNVSGDMTLTDITVTGLTVSNVSGELDFSGSCRTAKVDTVSGDCTLTLTAAPNSIDLDSVSGQLVVALPENTGFTANLDSLSGKLYSDFATTYQDDTMRYLDGACKISMDSVSGDLRIRQSGTF